MSRLYFAHSSAGAEGRRLALPVADRCCCYKGSRVSGARSAPSRVGLSWRLAPRHPDYGLRAQGSDSLGRGNEGADEDDELDKLLGIGRYRGTGGGMGSSNSIFRSSDSASHASSGAEPASASSKDGRGGDGATETQDALADIMQMEVRRVRVKEELMSDIEDRKAQMRAIGEEMKAALAREFELDRMRTEMGANYAMSEALQALDDVEAEVQRIKQQVQADKAELAAWEEQAAEDRSKGLFFKSLYALDKQQQQQQRQQSAAAPGDGAAADDATAATASTTDASSSGAGAGGWDAEAAAAAAERPLSAASRRVRSPLRLYLFSYLSAFLALLVVNDITAAGGAFGGSDAGGASPPLPPEREAPARLHVVRDAVCGALSAGLAWVAVRERAAMTEAQEAMLEGIRRTGGGKGDDSQQAGGGGGGGGGGSAHRRRRR